MNTIIMWIIGSLLCYAVLATVYLVYCAVDKLRNKRESKPSK